MMNGRERPRMPPAGDTPPVRDPRRAGDGRNGAFLSPGDNLSRAEKFEDEKRRIIGSCFNKKDSDGALTESYITHVRITEDSAYPSIPPPPTSQPENKKVRIIVVAVRKSGRVRMHKARENHDGSFSIGKTWQLDDLSQIQSYNAFVPSTPAEQQQKQWASNVGFTVTIQKPYYWHARSSKEKEFFIGSLLKIYRKYTGGKVPKLIGFDDRERQLLVGTAPTPRIPQGNTPPGSAPAPPHSLSSQGSHPQSPFVSPTPSRDDLRRQASEEHSLRAQRSRDQIRKPIPGQPAKSAVPPALAPPQVPPPAIPQDQRDQPPGRPGDLRMPKTPMMAPELTNREFLDDIPAVPPLSQKGKPYGDSEVSSFASSQPDLQPPSSRDGKGAPELRPALRTQNSAPSAPGSPETKRSKDGLRPTTPASVSGDSRNIAQSPASSLGRRHPFNESSDKISIPEVLVQSGDNITMNGSVAGSPSDFPTAAVADTPPVTETAEAFPPIPTQEAAPDESIPSAAAVSSPTSPPEPSDPAESDPDAHRPGLGPMVKKRDVAGVFRKAATAYGAFKPRPGGAGERLLAAAKKQQMSTPDEPDGINSVVPAPSLLKTGNEPATPETPDRELTSPIPSLSKEPPMVEVTQAAVEEATIEADEPRDSSRAAVKVDADDKSRTLSPSPGRRRRREDNTIKYCQALGIDPKVLDGRGVNFDDILTDLGWSGRLSDDKRVEDLEADVRREIGRVEATSWLGNLEQQEGKVDHLARLIDKTIEECDELDGLLTLYAHELNTLHDDVSYIETQSQGLQVQTANQKLLHSELQSLLRTLSISPTDLQPLKDASLSNPDKLSEAEYALSTLYKAMLMIDPDIRQNKKRLVDAAGEHSSVGVYADTEIGQMRAIKEKKEEYRTEARMFLRRLGQFMSTGFKVAEHKRIEAAANSPHDPMKLENGAHGYFRQELWMYNPLMLFAREVSAVDWQELIKLYEQQAKPPYQNQFRDNNLAWKKEARKPTGEEQELLFTHQDKEKENEGITMAARKLTVRRGKTIKAAAGLKLGLGEKQNGKLEPYEAFSGTLRETLNSMFEEQNFVVQFFHLNSLVNADFPDLVASARPDERSCPDFSARQSHDPDREMSKKVEQIMDELFSFWPNEMQNLVDWAIGADPLQGVGILLALETALAEFDDTNQEFIIHSLQKLHTRLVGLFNRFVDEQIRGIEETKVKVNKRRGVISFMRVFPSFSTAVESMLAQPSNEFSDIRISVNGAYDRINRAMWESLKFIAKEAPGQQPGVPTGTGDPEDKEALNYHILLIENMNHYIEEVDVRSLPVLERWRDRAHEELTEHMKLYLDSVIRRPLGRLLEFVESTESLLSAGNKPSDVANRASHSRSVAKKVLAAHDSREVRRGIELLKKRVEKHFGDADDPGLSRSLVLKVLRECEGRYGEVHDRTRHIIDTIYEGQLDLDWRKEDAAAMFKK